MKITQKICAYCANDTFLSACKPGVARFQSRKAYNIDYGNFDSRDSRFDRKWIFILQKYEGLWPGCALIGG